MDLFSPPDINECEDEEVRRQCHHGCENTDGSYRCLEPPTTTTTTSTTHTPPPPGSEEQGEGEDEDYEEEEEEGEAAPATTLATPIDVPVSVGDGAPCQDGYRRDVNGVCTGEIPTCIICSTYSILSNSRFKSILNL